MLQEVSLGARSLADYTHVVGKDLVAEIRDLAASLAGKRVLHVNATAFGGGVAEILYTLVPLMNDIGLDAHWQVMLGRDEFFDVTKQIHNTLQGDPREISDADWATYERYNLLNAMGMDGEWDLIVIHDPQPAMIRREAPDLAGSWMWRCHIDVSTPNPSSLARLLPYVNQYDAAFFHIPEYVPPGLAETVDARIVPPAIDPLSPKNMAFSVDDAAFIAQQFGVDPDRPLLLQVSRFDPWKDPSGVIDAYRIVRREVPGVQLALVGSMASDDPEGWEFYNATVAHAEGDPEIKILSNLNNVGAIEVNAFQSLADVNIQKSLKEGFGLTVTESMWKGRPTIGGAVGGIVSQISDGETGFLVSSPQQCAERCIELLADPELGRRLGRNGKEHARRNFLTPRLLRDYVRLMADLAV